MTVPKYRAWDGDVMCPVEAICFNGQPTITIHYNPVIKRRLVDVELMQFTGLQDKNGVDIYGGYIVKYSRTGGNIIIPSGELIHIGIVSWDDKRCCFSFKYNFSGGGGYTTIGLEFNDMRFPSSEIVVVGNIHEDQELTRQVRNGS